MSYSKQPHRRGELPSYLDHGPNAPAPHGPRASPVEHRGQHQRHGFSPLPLPDDDLARAIERAGMPKLTEDELIAAYGGLRAREVA